MSSPAHALDVPRWLIDGRWFVYAPTEARAVSHVEAHEKLGVIPRALKGRIVEPAGRWSHLGRSIEEDAKP